MAKGYCLICYKSIYNNSGISTFLSTNSLICDQCLNKFEIINRVEKVLNVETLFLYKYNNFIRKLIYQYKGCYDIALKDVFLYKYKKMIQSKYRGYTLIFPPSSKEEDEKRNFMHLEEIIKTLHMKYQILFYKKEVYKQSSHHFKQRSNIHNVIEIIDKNKIKNIKYLIVDDIYTSGSTLKTIISLLITNKVDRANIKALIIAKTFID